MITEMFENLVQLFRITVGAILLLIGAGTLIFLLGAVVMNIL